MEFLIKFCARHLPQRKSFLGQFPTKKQKQTWEYTGQWTGTLFTISVQGVDWTVVRNTVHNKCPLRLSVDTMLDPSTTIAPTIGERKKWRIMEAH
jgi:hypothetical protein